jgi:hypothetical protein
MEFERTRERKNHRQTEKVGRPEAQRRGQLALRSKHGYSGAAGVRQSLKVDVARVRKQNGKATHPPPFHLFCFLYGATFTIALWGGQMPALPPIA